MRRAFVSNPKRLLEVVRQLATDVEPWAELVLCNPNDYRDAGLRGDATKTPVLKPYGSIAELLCLDRNAFANLHMVWLQPDADVPPGELRTVVKS